MAGKAGGRYRDRLTHAENAVETKKGDAAAIDTALAAMGLVRNVALWEPSFLAVASVVARTDLISTVPRRLATHVAQGLPITIYDLPLPLPAPEFAMYWHSRSQGDAGHKWLRERVAALLRA
jgi:DNA-binding transcriptional LysR family regulator